ncbi:MAG: Cas10/Cmr2 second palm domain-containing protein, partial [Blastocatellia bacterium]
MSDIAKIDEAVLTIIDTAGVQDYIFGSNRLRENIGASFLVEQATRDWVYEELDNLGEHNIANRETGEIDRNKKMENAADDLSAELIYAGGGNTAILFRSKDEAKAFTWELSKRVLRAAPGLEIVIAHSEPFKWRHDARDLSDIIKDLRERRLAQKKRTCQVPPMPLLGLSVTAECASTGLVATQSSLELEAEPRLVSREIMAKLEATHKDKPGGEIRNEAKRRLLNYLRENDQGFNADEFEFSDELDHLGRTGGEESYIAVVHIDGNSMGEMIKDYVADTKDNREYIERLRDFSIGVEWASKAALVKTLRTLSRHIRGERDLETNRAVWQVIEAIPPPLVVPKDKLTIAQQKRIRLFEEDKNGKPCWPFRPLVFGGDDVTFVCNGQLGLSLATVFMDAVTAETRELMKDSPHKEVHTGAGVCIVKVHYPFRRAYELSAQLTKQAKHLLGDQNREASALDWHIS